jgi:predicted DNA-binding transcriptional regulator YafY
MERLVRLAAALSAHPKRGLHVDKLVDIAGFELSDSGREQVQRELRSLERQGWQILRTLDLDGRATYRMITLDNRLKVRLSLPQLAALQRAALVVKRSDLVERLGLAQGDVPTLDSAELRLGRVEAALNELLEAMRHRARVRYRYRGSERVAHPQLLREQNGKWYLRAVEEGGEVVKTFAVSRMGKVEVDEPGTAHRVATERHIGLHPMRWEVDPPVEVMLRTEATFRPDVVRWLQEPNSEQEQDGGIDMRYRITNRSAFRHRLYELGTRVELLGPAAMRDEVLAELELIAARGEA